MAEETPPPQMPYLFAALASRVWGGGEARPSSPSPTPSWGDTGARSFPPILTLTFGVGIFTWRTAASLLRTKPRELYSDTRELLAREEEHAGRLPAAGDKKAAGWSLRHRERWMRCSFLGRKRDSEPQTRMICSRVSLKRTQKNEHAYIHAQAHAQRCILTSPAFCFLDFAIISQVFKYELHLPHTNLSSL